MKLLPVTLLLALFCSTALAQSGSLPPARVFQIDSLPPQGILLDKGWKWHAGDNPEWAKPDFDDSAWESIDPTKDIMDLPQVRKAGIGWLRLNLHVDSTLLQQQAITLLVGQVAASVLYSNGQLILRLGTVSPNADEVDAVSTTFHTIGLPGVGKSTYALAVRIAVQPNLPYTKFGNVRNTLYRVYVVAVSQLDPLRPLSQRRYNFLTYTFVKAGLFFILALLHLCFFIFYPLKKANLFFAISSLLFFLHWLVLGLRNTSLLSDLDTLMYVGQLRAVLFPVNYICLVTALYTAYALPKSFYYWAGVGACGLLIVIYFLNYQSGVPWIEIGSTIVMTAEAIRITVMAVVRKHRGVNIILIGLVFSFVGLSMRYLTEFTSLLPYFRINNYANTFDNFGVLSLPLFLSVYLASEFAFASKSLAAQLVAVKQLSAQTLAQEQEKQQILATQNEVLENQVAARTIELQHSLENLKATQNQLIQKEKMASLGELTAGIAHEIQNPLNFVNNFSEVSVELVDELDQELERGETQEARVIADDLRQNLQRITQNGQRASNIVKGMLEHSRSSTGERQPTNLNALCDEYLRLAFQGQRAKNKAFECVLETHFDPDLPPISVVAQDLSRVLLNLFNNAFYAVGQKQKTAPADYQPTISVSTEQINGQVVIHVGDNGMGIPDAIREKIFQPFFTTKPTGEGTGLGLSLSYDMVTKGHGGTLEVESEAGQFTEFVITLPTNFLS